MSLTLSIEISGPARIGDHLEAVVVIESDSARTIDGLDLEFVGKGMLYNDQQRPELRTIFEHRGRLLGKTALEKGARCVPVSLALPADLPPTCDGGDIWVSYHVRAIADVPWWFDPVAFHDVILLLPRPSARPAPQRWVTQSEGRGDDLYVELALDDTAFAPGESITGAFSVGNVGSRRLDGAGVSLLREGNAVALGVPGAAPIFKSLVGAGEGSVLRFSLPLPADAVPSHESRFGRVARAVVVSVDGSGASCAAPIIIDAFPPRTGQAEPRAELVGGSRWRSLWHEAGARFGLTCDRAALRLHGTLAGGAVEVTVKPRGNQLSAQLSWEPLGIDLAVTRRGLIEVTDVDLGSDAAGFSKRFAARGREDAQVVAALTPDLCAAIAQFGEIVLRDGGARVGMDAQARDAPSLRLFLHHIDALASAVIVAEARVPPPACFHEDAATAWRSFAESTTGRLRAGSMIVRGALLDGDRVDVETLFEAGSVDGTRLTLRLDPEVPGPDPVVVPEPLLAAARAVVRGRNDPPLLDLHASSMVVTLPGMVADPADLRPLIAAMQRFAQSLRGETSRGPYR